MKHIDIELLKVTDLVAACTNIKSLTYTVDRDEWTIYYKLGKPDTVKSNDLIEFLCNA